eukprot:1188792-Amphidinium_carterae.1
MSVQSPSTGPLVASTTGSPSTGEGAHLSSLVRNRQDRSQKLKLFLRCPAPTHLLPLARQHC